MRKRKRSVWKLLLGILLLFTTAYIALSFSPYKNLPHLSIPGGPTVDFALSPVLVFFLFLFLAIYFIVSFVLYNKAQGFVFSLTIIGFLLLRYYDLHNLFFVTLLIAVFAALQLFLKYQRR